MLTKHLNFERILAVREIPTKISEKEHPQNVQDTNATIKLKRIFRVHDTLTQQSN